MNTHSYTFVNIVWGREWSTGGGPGVGPKLINVDTEALPPPILYLLMWSEDGGSNFFIEGRWYEHVEIRFSAEVVLIYEWRSRKLSFALRYFDVVTPPNFEYGDTQLMKLVIQVALNTLFNDPAYEQARQELIACVKRIHYANYPWLGDRVYGCTPPPAPPPAITSFAELLRRLDQKGKDKK